jgi:hypothetical protein
MILNCVYYFYLLSLFICLNINNLNWSYDFIHNEFDNHIDYNIRFILLFILPLCLYFCWFDIWIALYSKIFIFTYIIFIRKWWFFVLNHIFSIIIDLFYNLFIWYIPWVHSLSVFIVYTLLLKGTFYLIWSQQ